MKRSPYALPGLVAGVLLLIGCTMLQLLDGSMTEGAARSSRKVTATYVGAAHDRLQDAARATPTWTISPVLKNVPLSDGTWMASSGQPVRVVPHGKAVSGAITSPLPTPTSPNSPLPTPLPPTPTPALPTEVPSSTPTLTETPAPTITGTRTETPTRTLTFTPSHQVPTRTMTSTRTPGTPTVTRTWTRTPGTPAPTRTPANPPPPTATPPDSPLPTPVPTMPGSPLPTPPPCGFGC